MPDQNNENEIFLYNMNVQEREQILFGQSYDEEIYNKYGKIRSFKNVPASAIRQLIEKKFMDPEQKQNNSPSIKEMMEYANAHENVTFDGYAVSPDRNDYRVSIDTIRQQFHSAKDVADFASAFHYADDFVANETSGFAWWD